MGGRGFAGCGAAVDGKWGIKQRAARERGWTIAAGPEAGYHQLNVGGAPTHALMLTAPVLFGFNTGRAHGNQIVLGPRLMAQRVFGPFQEPLNVWQFGSSFGYLWAPRDNVEVFSQLVWTYAPLSFNGTFEDPERTGYVFAQIGIGFSLLR